MKKLLLSLLCLLAVGLPSLAAEQSYTIEFKTATSDASGALSATSSLSTFIQSGSEYISGIKATNNVYAPAINGLKFSSSSSNGAIEFNLSSSGAVEATKVVVNAMMWKNTESASIAVNGGTSQELTASLADYTFTLNGSEITTLKLSATKRAYVKSVTVYYNSEEGYDKTVETPVITPSSQTFSESFTATISCSTPNAKIYYSIDGNNPSTSSSLYSNGVEIPAATTTLKAIAVADGMNNSEIATEIYTYEPPLPPVSGNEESYTINFLSTGSGDNSSAMNTSTAASNYIESGDAYISSIASTNNVYPKSKDGLKFSSSSVNGAIKWNLSTAGQVNATKIVVYASQYGSDACSLSVNGSSSQTVKGSTLDYYTFDLDGSALQTITLSSTKRLYVKSITVYYNTGESTVVTMPVISPASKEFSEAFEATITCSTDGAQIYYTIDGTDPTTNSNLYNGTGVNIPTGSNVTLKAIATKSGMTNSGIASATYTYVDMTAYQCANIAEWLTKASADTSHAYTITGTVTAAVSSTTVSNGSDKRYLWITDDSGSTMVYGNNFTYTAGQTFTGLSGQYSLYQGNAQMQNSNITSLTPGEGTAPQPKVMNVADITATNANSYIQLDNVTVNTSAKTFAQDGKTIAYYDKFSLNLFAEDGDYNVTGVAVAYNGNMQVYPLTAEKAATVITPYWQIEEENYNGKLVTVTYNSAGEYTFPTFYNPSEVPVTFSCKTVSAGTWSNYISLDTATGEVTEVKKCNNTDQQRPVVTATWDGGSASYTIQINRIQFSDVQFPGYSLTQPYEYIVGVTPASEFPKFTANPVEEMAKFPSTYTYTSSVTDVATVTPDGVVNFNGKPGSTNIGVRVSSNSDFALQGNWPELFTLNVKLSDPVIKVTDKDGKEIANEAVVSTANGPYTVSIQNRNNNEYYKKTYMNIIGTCGEDYIIEEYDEIRELTWSPSETFNTPGVYNLLAFVTADLDYTGDDGTDAMFTFTIEAPAVAPTWQLDGKDVTKATVTYSSKGEYTLPTLNNPSNLPITYSVTNAQGNTTTSNDQYVKINAETGELTIGRPCNPGNQNYMYFNVIATSGNMKASYQLTINKITFDVKWIGVGEDGTFTAIKDVTTFDQLPQFTVEPADEAELFTYYSYMSSNTDVATVSDGLILYNGTGETTIGIRKSDTTYANAGTWADGYKLIVVENTPTTPQEPVIKGTAKDGSAISDYDEIEADNTPVNVVITNPNADINMDITVTKYPLGDEEFENGEDIIDSKNITDKTWTLPNGLSDPGIYMVQAFLSDDDLGLMSFLFFTIKEGAQTVIAPTWQLNGEDVKRVTVDFNGKGEYNLPTLYNPSNLPITYSLTNAQDKVNSSNESYVKVSEDGVVTILKPCNPTNSNYSSFNIIATSGEYEARYTLVVNRLDFKITGIEGMVDGVLTVTLGETAYFPPIQVEPADEAEAYWKVGKYNIADTGLARIDTYDNEITTYKTGESTFTIQSSDNGYANVKIYSELDGHTFTLRVVSAVEEKVPVISVAGKDGVLVEDMGTIAYDNTPVSVSVENPNGDGTTMDVTLMKAASLDDFYNNGQTLYDLTDLTQKVWTPTTALTEPGFYYVQAAVKGTSLEEPLVWLMFTIEAAPAPDQLAQIAATDKNGTPVEDYGEVELDNAPVNVVVTNPNGDNVTMDVVVMKADSMEGFDNAEYLYDLENVTARTWSPDAPFTEPGVYFVDIFLNNSTIDYPESFLIFTILGPGVVDYAAPTVKFYDSNDEEVTSGTAAAPAVFSVTNAASQADIYYYIGEDEVTEDTMYLRGDDKFMVEVDLNEPGTYYYSTYVASYDGDTLTGTSSKVNGTFVVTNYVPAAATFAVTDNTGATVANGASVAEANAPVKVVVTDPNNNDRYPTSMNITVVNTSNNQSEEYTTPNASYDFYVNASGVYEVTVVVSQEDTKVSSSFGFTIEGDVAYTVLPAYVMFLDKEGNEVESPANVLPITMVIGNENDFEDQTVTMTYYIDGEEYTTTNSKVTVAITEPGTFEYSVYCSVNSKSESPVVSGTFTVTADAVKLAEPVISFSNVEESHGSDSYVTAVNVTITNPNIDGVGTIMYSLDGETWTEGNGTEVTFTLDEDGKYTIMAYVRNDSHEDLSSDTVTEVYTFTGVESMFFGVEGVKVIGGHIVVPEGAEVYSINGMRVNTLERVSNGIYIVRLANGVTTKIIVK